MPSPDTEEHIKIVNNNTRFCPICGKLLTEVRNTKVCPRGHGAASSASSDFINQVDIHFTVTPAFYQERTRKR